MSSHECHFHILPLTRYNDIEISREREREIEIERERERERKGGTEDSVW